MTMSFEAPSPVVDDDRTSSLARRMIDGAAAASLYAYRMDEALPFLAHGTDADGSLVVAAAPLGMLSVVAPGAGVDVRMDLVKQAPDASVEIVAASVHLLGTLAWAAPAEVVSRLASGSLPPMVSAMLEAPGALLGFVEVERLILHDMDGATVISPDALRGSQPVIKDEYAAYDLVACRGQEALKDLCWAVMVGAVPGEVVSKEPLSGICAHTAERAFCVDVGTLGVTVMLVGRHETLVVHARFTAPAESQDELGQRVADLMTRAAPLAA